MTDPEIIDKEAVDKIHDRQDNGQLPEARKKSARAVHRVYADKHIGDITGEAAELENNTVALYPFVRRQPGADTTLLYLVAVQMHHADSAFSYTDSADENEQDAKPQPLKDDLEDQFIHFRYLAASFSSSDHTGYFAPFSSKKSFMSLFSALISSIAFIAWSEAQILPRLFAHISLKKRRHYLVKTVLFCEFRYRARRKFIIYRLVFIVGGNIHLVIMPPVASRLCAGKRLIHQSPPERFVAVNKFQLAEGRQDKVFLNLLDLAEGGHRLTHNVIAHDGYAVVCTALAVVEILFAAEVGTPIGEKFHIFKLDLLPHRIPLLGRVMQCDPLLYFGTTRL